MNALIRIVMILFSIFLSIVKVIYFVMKVIFNLIHTLLSMITTQSLILPLKYLLFIGIILYSILNIVGEIPSALNLNLVIVSATLGGLVLAAALFIKRPSSEQSSDDTQHDLLGIAKEFILSTALLLFFYLFWGVAQLLDVAPCSIEVSWIGLGRALTFWIAAVGLFGGAFIFSNAMINLIVLLKKINRPAK